MHVSELDTPALLIDLDILEKNLARVAGYAKANNLRLRPHTKTHKLPAIGKRQIASGAIGLSYGLAPEHSVSEYQAVWSLGMGMARALGPAVLTFVCIKGGLPGWLALGGAFLAAGAAAPSLARRVTAARAEADVTAMPAPPRLTLPVGCPATTYDYGAS